MDQSQHSLKGAECDDSSTEAGPVCRICYRGSRSGGPLLSPCVCKGSMGLTHRTCLERWLRERDTDQCNVCLARFRVRRQHPPLRKFFAEPRNRRDVLRMVVNLVSATGDVVVLVFAWSYAARFLGGLGWFLYLLVVALLVFQTFFWVLVECARVWTCYEPVREWRRRAVTLEIITDDPPSSSSIPLPKEEAADVEKGAAPSFPWKPALPSPYRPAVQSPSSPGSEGSREQAGADEKTTPSDESKASPERKDQVDNRSNQKPETTVQSAANE
ncbi:uncharacterized protein LOC144119262 [Amblyomma americanum]